MKKQCEHLVVDDWHVASHQGRELVRLPAGGRYGWGAQFRSEMSAGWTRWMWPGILGLLALGLVIGDMWLTLGSAATLVFFAYQTFRLMSTLAAGEVVVSTCRDLTSVDGDGEGEEPLPRAITTIKGRRCEVEVVCDDCADRLRAKQTLELAVLVDPNDTSNNWLVGFREA